MGFLSWLVVGAAAGWLAGDLMRGAGYGLLGNMLIGIIGAVIGGFLAEAWINATDPLSGINMISIIVAFLGSVFFLALLARTRGKRV